jgi:hypothetical protein
LDAGAIRFRAAAAISILAVLALAVAIPDAASAKQLLRPNPADDPELLHQKLDPVRYDGAGGCRKKPPKGMRELIKWMKRNTKRDVYYGTIRCDGGVHGTGRALDWALDARKKNQKGLAMRVINTWRAKDARGRVNALARRMGIQMVIYNCRFWQAGDTRMSRYSACRGRGKPDPTQGHIDHIHIELTEAAAKLRTSFWRSDLGGGGGDTGGGVSPP